MACRFADLDQITERRVHSLRLCSGPHGLMSSVLNSLIMVLACVLPFLRPAQRSLLVRPAYSPNDLHDHLHRRLRLLVTSATAPIVGGRSNSCQVGVVLRKLAFARCTVQMG